LEVVAISSTAIPHLCLETNVSGTARKIDTLVGEFVALNDELAFLGWSFMPCLNIGTIATG
jgi:hypothetical protein